MEAGWVTWWEELTLVLCDEIVSVTLNVGPNCFKSLIRQSWSFALTCCTFIKVYSICLPLDWHALGLNHPLVTSRFASTPEVDSILIYNFVPLHSHVLWTQSQITLIRPHDNISSLYFVCVFRIASNWFAN